MKISAIPFRGVIFFLLILFFGFVYLAGEAHAATLGRTSARLSTSRPSVSAPLNADQAADADQVTITDLSDNIMFLASDSAVLRSDTGQTQNTVTIASASAADTPAASQRILYFTGSAANTHHSGTAIFTAITAMWEISFNVISEVPTSGDIELYFPALTSGDSNNPASPSATTFQLNDVVNGTGGRTSIEVTDDGTAITASVTITATNPSSGTSPRITINVDSGTITAGSSVKVFLGCTTVASNACSVHDPRIINTTQSATALGTARIWNLRIDTEDSDNVRIDNTNVRIGTVDAVLVQGTVDPSLTVTIAGVNDATNINGTSGCASETTNSGISSTATSVNLGAIGTTINIAAQTITVSTNAAFGYTITATSSGRFLNPSSGFYIPDVNIGNGLTANDTPIPAALTAGTPAFGVFPCGTRPPTSSPDYDDEDAIGAGGAFGTNPWQSGVTGFYATIASFTGAVSSDVTALRYAVTASATTPAGIYFNYFTYVVTGTF